VIGRGTPLLLEVFRSQLLRLGLVSLQRHNSFSSTVLESLPVISPSFSVFFISSNPCCLSEMTDIRVAFEMAASSTESFSFKFESRHSASPLARAPADTSGPTTANRERMASHSGATATKGAGGAVVERVTDSRARDLAARLSLEEQVCAKVKHFVHLDFISPAVVFCFAFAIRRCGWAVGKLVSAPFRSRPLAVPTAAGKTTE
jgi:hypothetical protein